MALRKYMSDLTHCLSSQEQLLPVTMQLYSSGFFTEEVNRDHTCIMIILHV